jgi:hypothetical protein
MKSVQQLCDDIRAWVTFRYGIVLAQASSIARKHKVKSPAWLMMLIAVAALPCGAVSGRSQPDRGVPAPAEQAKPPWTITSQESDRERVAGLDACLRSAQRRIEGFFGHPFLKPFHVEIFANRSQFDAYFKQRWQLPKTEAWMVAMGVSDKLAILSPGVWKTQAVEHDPNDPLHFQELVAHELVHVYHGQHNPTGDFDGMDDLGWFVEGLAVYVSGQLEHGHKDAARKALAAGKAPKKLAKAWSGAYRYGVSGSMVQFVDERYGRQMLWQLLPETKPARVLERLKLSEDDFLRAWRDFVLTKPKSP